MFIIAGSGGQAPPSLYAPVNKKSHHIVAKLQEHIL
jgi:hypothetical protein